MKKLILAILMTASAIALNGQAIGIQAGLNFSNSTAAINTANGLIDGDFSNDNLKSITGIRIGPVVQFKLGPVFELHSGAIYSQKGNENIDPAHLSKIIIDYIEVPLALAAGFDLGGIGAFVKGGPVLGIGIGGKFDTELASTKIQFGSGEGETKLLDTGLTVGAGIKLGTLQIDASYDFSLSDLSNNEADFKNQVFHVGLSFVIGN